MLYFIIIIIITLEIGNPVNDNPVLNLILEQLVESRQESKQAMVESKQAMIESNQNITGLKTYTEMKFESIESRLPPLIPLTVSSTHIETPIDGQGTDHISPVINEPPLYIWEPYVVSKTTLAKDFYYSKLHTGFVTHNTSNIYQLQKTRNAIRILKNRSLIFNCPREVYCQRNLYLEFYDCKFNCEMWYERFQLSDRDWVYQDRKSPPEHSTV